MTPVMSPGPPRHRLGGYREYAPPSHIEQFVDSLWTHRAPEDLPAGPGARHRVLPDPALSLAFSCRRDPNGRPLDPAVVIIGPKHRPHIFAFQPGRELAAVRVKLEWSAALLDLEPGDHGDAERDLAAVHPVLLAELLRKLAEEGRPVEWIQDSLRLDDIRRRVPAWTGKEDEDWDYIVRTAIERVWRGVRGQG